MKKIGIIGGGQLAWMLGLAARSLSLQVGVLPETIHDPGVPVVDYVANSITSLAAWADLITFENEFIDIRALQELEDRGTTFRPSLASLAHLIDKYAQKIFLAAHDIPVPAFFPIDAEQDIRKISFPAVLKSCTHGYDGKGTRIVYSPGELTHHWQQMGNMPAIVESFIEFEKELAIMVGRSMSGEITLFPIVETQQEQQVCRRVIVPAAIGSIEQQQLEQLAKDIVTQLNYVGILGIEFFLTKDGKILVNEMAPRPHNSAHLTIEACETSQFEQLLRIVSGLPLGSTSMTTPAAVMVNLLGQEDYSFDYTAKRLLISQLPQTYVHWYGKQQSRPGRKLGHVTSLVSSYAQATDRITAIEAIWYGH